MEAGGWKLLFGTKYLTIPLKLIDVILNRKINKRTLYFYLRTSITSLFGLQASLHHDKN